MNEHTITKMKIEIGAEIDSEIYPMVRLIWDDSEAYYAGIGWIVKPATKAGFGAHYPTAIENIQHRLLIRNCRMKKEEIVELLNQAVEEYLAMGALLP